MPLTPVNWNVVVLGPWNESILTPAGIIQLLFKLPPKAEPMVQIPMQSRDAATRVVWDDIGIACLHQSLYVELATTPNYKQLAKAMDYARLAIETFPDVKVRASGINIRYHAKFEDDNAQRMKKIVANQVDDAFKSKDHEVLISEVDKKIRWKDGTSNIVMVEDHEDSTIAVYVNFERRGSRGEQIDWLSQPVDELRGQADEIIINLLGFKGGIES